MPEIVLQFSGGKDSLAALYLLRPFWPVMEVHWTNSGRTLPEVREWMLALFAQEGMPKFVEVQGDRGKGIAVEFVPARGDDLFVSPYACCASALWQYSAKAVVDSGAGILARGSKKSDTFAVPDLNGKVVDGILYHYPLWDKSDEWVKDYLAREGVPLPPHYEYFDSSMDCWDCTAALDHKIGKMRYLREHHPEKAAALTTVITFYKNTLLREVAVVTAFGEDDGNSTQVE